jgi:hypothetical protein
MLVSLLASMARAERTASSPAEAALVELEAWLDSSPHGAKWREYLRLDQTRQELARGDSANLATVAESLEAFSTDAPGLNHETFAKARTALSNWYATETQRPLADLPQLIDQAKGQFTPLTAAAVEQRRQRLVAAIGRLETFLAQANESTQSGWKTFLRWDDLQREAAKTTEPDLTVLGAVRDQLASGEVGLELKPFADVRLALRNYINGVLVLSNPNMEETYRQAMDLLKERVQGYLDQPSTDAASQIAEVLAFLHDIEQAPQVAAAIHRHFNEPNLQITVSRELMAAAVDRDVDEPAEVNEVILGTAIRGAGRTRGRLTLSLAPSDDRATLLMNLDAQADTHNIGVNGPVTIYSTGSTEIHAVHEVFLTELGLVAGHVAAQACARSNIYCIAAKLRIIEHIAWRKARESQPQAEAIASGRAARRAEQQFSDQITEQLKEPNEQFQERFRAPLLRNDAMPELMRFSTTLQELLVLARHATERQLASPSSLPAAVGGDLSVRIHESAVGNFSESAFAGKTFTADDIQEVTDQLPGEFADESEEAAEDREWSITFRSRHPLSAQFRDGQTTNVIHFTSFMSDGEVYDFPIDIAASYRIEDSATGPKLVRQGRVQITWPGPRRPRFGQRAVLESKFRLRFERLFRDELFVRDIAPPDAPEGFGVLRDFVIRAEDGWMTVGLRRIKPN